MRDQVDAAVASARRTGWDELVSDQRDFLERFWKRADVEIDGDGELQQAVRFALFHALQAGARAERRAIGGKGLTGPGYDGHVFWDTETYVLPLLTYTHPEAVRDALLLAPLDARPRSGARAPAAPGGRGVPVAHDPRARVLGVLAGRDRGVSRQRRHRRRRHPLPATRSTTRSSSAAPGLELLVNTARLCRSLGHHDHSGAFHIDGVTGPDEYSAVVDDNVYTNLMAEQNLRVAADVAARHPDEARALGVDEEEIASWRDAAHDMYVPFDERLQIHPQDVAFTRHELMDLEDVDYPLMLHLPYVQLYRKQVLKQPDLVLALLMRGDRFTASEKARDFAYYEPLTVRDSSLSACVQAAVAAEVGHLELAYDYFGEAALMDLGDLAHNTRDGLHMASLAGSWIAAVAGFGGMRNHGDVLSFRPRLPAALSRLRFRVGYRGSCLSVEITHAEARYELQAGEAVEVRHEDEPLTVAPGEPVTRGWSVPDPGPSRAAAGPRAAPRRPQMSIARIDASSGSLASSSWMIRWTSAGRARSRRASSAARVHDLQLRGVRSR